MTISAVLFDFGGVFTSSPFEAFNTYEAEAGLPKDLVRTINATDPDDNAWARLERAEVSVSEFVTLFNTEGAALGHDVDGHRVLKCLSGALRPEMVVALDIIATSYQVGCITNNVRSSGGDSTPAPPRADVDEVMERFDVVIESSKVGLRKPDPAIYRLACDELGISPNEAVYLDDLGVNCKPARSLGMTTIKVLTGEQAIDDLESILAISLRSPSAGRA